MFDTLTNMSQIDELDDKSMDSDAYYASFFKYCSSSKYAIDCHETFYINCLGNRKIENHLCSNHSSLSHGDI